MEPHLLRTFVTVADCGSFSAAAEQLGYTQSAVSQHIAALESDLGTPLLHRRPVAPTASGERLLEHAGPILLRLEAARADVRRTVAGPPSVLALAAAPLAADRLATALVAVRRSHPGTEVSLTVCGREQVVEAVATGEFALGLVDGIAAPSDPLRLSDAVRLRTSPIAHDDLVVALPNDHPLAHRRGLSLDDLTDARWIDAPDAAVPLASLRAATRAGGLRPALTCSGTDVHTLLALVAAGHGLAVLPQSIGAPGVTGVPLTAPRLVHRIELLHGLLSEPAAAALAAVLSDRE
ncbi:LysR family transcriptional regulator [Kribbella sp. NPDC004875]|uniref:LysR family transcriptional regulator n=1 Tax=Kribbella sp. NPDC004875 TaxID=3364107 RepID=UPI0036AE240B